MATATVPAAVPDPNEPPNNSTGSAPSGLLASMLAPVDPARPAAFDIPAPAEAVGNTDAPAAGASSAAYHGSTDAADATKNSGRTVEKKGIWRAWLLAGAARWAKGGGAHNKRLDMEKAKASARQLKEDRKVSINRSDGLPGKGVAGACGNSGVAKGNSSTKSPNKAPEKGPSKVAPKEQVKSPRNTNGSAHQGPAGRSGGSSGPAGGAVGRGGHGASPKNGKADAGRDQKPKVDKPKIDLSKDKGRAGGSTAGGKDGARGPAGGTGKNGHTTNGGGAKATGPAADTGKKNRADLVKGPAGATDTKRSGKGDSSGKDLVVKPSKPGSDAAVPGTGSGPVSLTKDRNGKDDKSKGGKDAQPQTKAEAGKQASGKAFSTKESREAGYRDGTRAARTVAHAKAYRDGIKDGWTDTTEAAERQKAQLDETHEERKKAREAARDEERDVSGAGSSADHHKPQPIEVKGVDLNTVWLGEGADRTSLSRGEVRSLKTFERRLRAKETSMKKIAEHTKALKAHAEAQSKKVTAQMEATKSVKGGTKLIAALTKTADLAKVQAAQAEQIHKRAVRAADRCTAVLANVETRYGGMYKAVVDSDEKVPGEMEFYGEGSTTHG